MIPCPQCTNKPLKLSDARGFVELKILPLLKLAPFLCSSCGRRFYRYHPGKMTAAGYHPDITMPIKFIEAQDGVSFQQLIKNLRDAESRLDNKGVAQRGLRS